MAPSVENIETTARHKVIYGYLLFLAKVVPIIVNRGRRFKINPSLYLITVWNILLYLCVVLYI